MDSNLVWLITGSSRGLGRAIATAALSAGHRVIASARNPADVADLVDRHGDRVRTVGLDVTDPAAARRAVAATVAAFGRLDVVVNNAGYADLASIEDVTDDDLRAQIDTNLFGPINVTRAALPILRTQGSGQVITISSVGGRMATPGLGAYQTAKWALGGFHSVLAAEVQPLGIRVTVVEPGGMRTDWAGSSMKVPPISGPYEQTVGRSARMHDDPTTTSGSDPDKVAQLILQLAGMDEPPLRLLVGSDAYKYGTAAGRALLASDETWHELSASTDHDDSDPDNDPLAALTTP